MQFTTFALTVLSIGSAFAAPTAVVRSDPKILTSAISEVSDAKSIVDSQVAIISMLHHLLVLPPRPVSAKLFSRHSGPNHCQRCDCSRS